ncbi:AMP-binding protein [Corynebacterium lactis]|uniref:Acyl-CoA synthetase n=1 Tax=Corynebacterium lactis RW2-5 TaxID=1408189 RepID=A0A0K2GXB4_9CORY|nr:AMP-binding protein [Corynebacterium lactis]ALA66429.1 acyl-CoA synthetase [Corynebacterium lactis RW2-5]
MAAEMKAPRVPLPFQLKALVQSVPPLLRSGALSMTPKQVLPFVNQILRLKFSAAALIKLGAMRYPDRLALVDDEGELTYTQLLEHSQSLARAMMDRGMNAKSSFGVIARNGRGIILPMAIKAFIGAEIMLMNIGSGPSQIQGVVKQNDAKFLFVDDEFLDRLPEDLTGVQIVITSVTKPDTRSKVPADFLFMDDLIKEGRSSSSEFEKKPEQGRIIIMSSGTTGIPKGVLRNEPKTPATLGAITDRIPWRKNMVIHQSASMFHAWGWANVIIALVTGATLVTMRVFDAQKAVDQCEKYGVNGMISAAFFLRQIKDVLDDQPSRKIGPFRFIVSSGNAIPGWLVSALTHRFGPVICNFYGSTEAGLCSIASGPDLATRPDSAGRPAIGAKVRILGEDGKELPAGEVGLIHTAQELSFIGYLSETDKFTTVDGLFQIGDLGRIDQDGYLYICGRSDDMVIKGGENIFPREVEEILGPVPGIADVFCHGSNENDEIFADLYLYVVRENSKQGAGLNEKMLQEYVRDNLAEHSVPDRVFFVNSLPRNAIGKVVPREVKAMHERLNLDAQQS